MTAVPTSCVIDASVCMKLFLREPLSERADVLFSLLGEDPFARIYVPALLYAECGQILWKYVREYGYPIEDARENLIQFEEIALSRLAISDLVSQALEIALEYGVTVYKACYIAAARALNVPLVTASKRLVRRFVGTGDSIIWLGDIEVSSGTKERVGRL